MTLNSVDTALDSYADIARELVTEAVRHRHERQIEAHRAAETRYSLVFGAQWRDLLDDVHDAFGGRGFQMHTLQPAGHRIPIVNNCLVYVWRVPADTDASSGFATSPTRRNGFGVSCPEPTLLDPDPSGDGDWETISIDDDPRLEDIAQAAQTTMPLVLVMVNSSPQQLRSIEWAVAQLTEPDRVNLHGRTTIWEPEPTTTSDVDGVEAFDSGEPVVPVVAVREMEGPNSNA